ncbi:GA REQUIRING 1, ARABIDOPSIS THALIANA ENT-COPALYL DIPHOSPHATE SYNTHETASE 1 [Hibiscus trionum]|uniref:GA REQUIRING 1, ARABIDOPSIS THALIANA ENT-COPALYL DIPHOSPHATE SYNTHETASE 1 n=1 Tax=Hibiscus trionum TaxID=183268 RepID=A0A9W7IR44_HIBTR|nr:GA REQUIRING 1, ARABIDOPSIS THALIANA ENT-COPALYL DIPHOSPHATE SYNTHETASE 1 [Hibiscus trionum]
MSSHSINLRRHHHHHNHRHLFRCSSTIPSPSSISFSYNIQPNPFAGTWQSWGKDKGRNVDIPRLCTRISNPRSKESGGVFQSGLPLTNLNQIADHDIQEKEAFKGLEPDKIKEHVDNIKSMLGSMENGEISCSAYDTAWVALIEDVNGSGSPQFPSTLEWIANNQLPDGSWGDDQIFVAHDRLINTLACVVALKTWNIHPDKYQKGISFFKENISKLENENAEHMPIGFEVAFPSLLEVARTLNIEVPYDSPVFQDIYESRDLKLTKIPKEIMHNVPTTLLHSLEGMSGLDWEKLLKLRCADGSFLFSPSSTAYAFMQTKDENCLEYLTKIVQRFNGGVPNVYPVDLFEHIWSIDRLQRLGISRYFKPEIKQCIDYVYRHWTEEGICWARNTRVYDIDDTAMGFRLLRLHGYDVSAEVFRHFEKGGEFFCFVGQSNQAVTGIYNLYRASQVRFPGDKILENATHFSSNFLRQKQAAHQLLDKWIIAKDLPGEVKYALEFPWHASLPRVETRFYIQQYGGEDDVWIGKTLYRMPYVSNNEYLELAKLDFNNCQALHQKEWIGMQKWYSDMGLGDFGMSTTSLLLTYFMAAASIFEPERSQERLAWAKTAFLVETIASSFDNGIIKPNDHELRERFLQAFTTLADAPFSHINGRKLDSNRTIQKLIDTLLQTLNHLSLDALVAHGRDISRGIRHAWEKWMLKWVEEGDRHQGVAELMVQTIILTSGSWSMEELLSHPHYERLSDLTNTVCHQLCHCQKQKVHDNGCFNNTDTEQMKAQKIESAMQELAQLVLQNSSENTDSEIKQTFLTVARSFYYAAHCDLETTISHIAKVLFEKVN